MASKIIGEFDILHTSTLGHKITGLQLKIGKRKHPTPDKPEYFLLLVTPTGKRAYVSSLYPDPQNKPENSLKTYYLDYERIGYILTRDDSTGVVKISPLSPTQNCANSNNIAQLGAKIAPK